MESAARWWEFYFVRYALGTLVGALIVNQALRVDARFSDFMLFGLGGDEPASRLMLVMGYGLVFCYVASVPILVLHASRLVIWIRPKYERQGSEKRKVLGNLTSGDLRVLACVLTCTTAVMMLLNIYIGFSREIGEDGFLLKLITSAVVAVVCIEWVALLILLFYSNRAYERMKMLSVSRARSANVGGIVDSYRHMREHGNSIFIVVLEFVLGAALIGVLSLIEEPKIESEYVQQLASALVPMLLLWILPGAGIWVFTALLERRFAFDRSFQG
ncbi:hypothetical protein [Pseudoxanthomonas sp. Root630]|uniref:hypothetical protein n=1 Tax=Pseudoxanthomonas sp. Root630 TaxID=1736574 RepID=UPI0007039B2A|nr:hypothetical protein [Pseudoxanthomonas sp. Root630]KRA41491.1 hypothetical protein ASD72_15545 [Pseudoxanthomonas sp. Root630]